MILLYGGILVLHDHLGVGTLFTFQAYMLIFQPPFRQLGMVIMNGQRASASAKRIYEILDQHQEIVNQPGAVDLVDCRGEVSFDHVGFAYSDGTRVLHDFDLHIAPGRDGRPRRAHRIGQDDRRPAAQPLLRRDRGRAPASTARDVRDYTLESLRAHVGFVFDEPFLFSVSIRDNIAYGKPDATIEEVVAAAKAADADEFIVRLPEGYDTVVGERGYTLSGGQRQRMAIARTLLINPPILVLDDATSAIDVQVEQRIHACAAGADGEPDDADHRPPARDDQPRGPGRAGRGRPRDRDRDATRTCSTNDPRYAEVLAQVVEEEPTTARGGPDGHGIRRRSDVGRRRRRRRSAAAARRGGMGRRRARRPRAARPSPASRPSSRTRSPS